MLAEALRSLADLVLPGECQGCDGAGQWHRYGVCPDCVAALHGLRPAPARPDPVPAGLPPTIALSSYGGPLRRLIIAYKERGGHQLARPLGALLAEAVAGIVPTTHGVRLYYVPDSAAAARARHGDHMRRLAAAAAQRLREAGCPVVVARELRAVTSTDSVGLGMAQRAVVAQGRFQARRSAGRFATRRENTPVVLVDDVMTTGVTLAAAAAQLSAAGLRVDACAVLAATVRHLPA